jgi:membrane protease YdiL (CAAX protease family)
MKMSKVYNFIILLGILLAIYLTLFSPIPPGTKLILRIFTLAGSLASWIFFMRKKNIICRDISFAMVALNFAFLIVMPFTASFWNLNTDTPRDLAFAKLSDSVIISFVIILCFLVAGYRFKSIYLSKGKLRVGLSLGIIFFLLFGYLALNNPEQKPLPGFVRQNIHWILIFVFANGFMEELIFRGILLEKLGLYFKPFWAIILTSVIFALPHIIVTYQPNVVLFTGIVFLLGLICGYAMHYTKSIIAPALIHAGADLMIIIPIYASFGVTG